MALILLAAIYTTRSSRPCERVWTLRHAVLGELLVRRQISVPFRRWLH